MINAREFMSTMTPGLDGFRATGLKREMTKSTKPPELQSTEWATAGGWIARESKVISAQKDIGKVDDPGQGALLDAELCLGSKTLQIRRLPGLWLLTVITETEGDGYLADDRLIMTLTHGAARYRRYWTIPDDGAAEVIACRLTGFEAIP